MEQPRACERPVSLRRARGATEKSGRFLDAEAAEEAQFHEPRETRRLGRELVEGAIEIDQFRRVHRRLHRFAFSEAEGHAGRVRAAALLRHLRARVIHEYPTHDPRRDSEEMRAIVPRHVGETAQAQIRFVRERGGLQRVAGPFCTQMTGGNRAKLGVDEWQEALERAVIALLPCAQVCGNPVVVDGGMIQGGDVEPVARSAYRLVPHGDDTRTDGRLVDEPEVEGLR